MAMEVPFLKGASSARDDGTAQVKLGFSLDKVKCGTQVPESRPVNLKAGSCPSRFTYVLTPSGT